MVFDKVKELISEQLDVKADDITEASNIQDDIPAVSGSALYGGIFVSVPMFCTIAHMDSADT